MTGSVNMNTIFIDCDWNEDAKTRLHTCLTVNNELTIYCTKRCFNKVVESLPTGSFPNVFQVLVARPVKGGKIEFTFGNAQNSADFVSITVDQYINDFIYNALWLDSMMRTIYA
ncbi:MAG: hypothetical protein QM490_03135 [Candidatus Gracilibacteria bacterium]